MKFAVPAMVFDSIKYSSRDQKVKSNNPLLYECETNVLARYRLISEIKTRYSSTYFNHIWGSGYTSGYYSNYWSKMLDSNAFREFNETVDISNKEVAARFDKEVFSNVGTGDPPEKCFAFWGTEPGIGEILKNIGQK